MSTAVHQIAQAPAPLAMSALADAGRPPRRRGGRRAEARLEVEAAGEVVFEDEALRIAVLRGNRRRVVVVFTGLALGTGAAKLSEFMGSGQGEQGNTVIFVADKQGLWYEGAGVAERIRDELRRLMADLAPELVLNIGNSMGGYGAVLFARDTGAQRVLAFGPQFSIKPGVVKGETRWTRVAERAGEVRNASLAEVLVPEVEYILLHGISGLDALQAARFPEAGNLHHYLFRDYDHDTGRALKEKGALGELIDAALKGRMRRVERILRQAGGVARQEVALDARPAVAGLPRAWHGPALLGAGGVLLAAADLWAGQWISALGGGLIVAAAVVLGRRA